MRHDHQTMRAAALVVKPDSSLFHANSTFLGTRGALGAHRGLARYNDPVSRAPARRHDEGSAMFLPLLVTPLPVLFLGGLIRNAVLFR